MKYFIGWDVGTWKCTNGNNKSCDALVVLDEMGFLGHHRGNLSGTIASVFQSRPDVKAQDMIEAWFKKCKVQKEYSKEDLYFVAIDTPLGWPKGFANLLGGCLPKTWHFSSDDYDIKNPLLFRRTERKLNSGFSVVTHSIGNQSTKGISLVCGLEASHGTWGVWTKDNVNLLETYPKACLRSERFVNWMALQPNDYDIREWYNPVDKKTKKRTKTLTTQDDTFDAAVCAYLAKAHATGAVDLVRPPKEDQDAEKSEGWIYYPEGTLIPESLADKYSSVTNSPTVAVFGQAVAAFQRHVVSNTNKKAGPRAVQTPKSTNGQET